MDYVCGIKTRKLAKPPSSSLSLRSHPAIMSLSQIGMNVSATSARTPSSNSEKKQLKTSISITITLRIPQSINNLAKAACMANSLASPSTQLENVAINHSSLFTQISVSHTSSHSAVGNMSSPLS